MPSALHRTPLFAQHQRHGAKFVPFAGFTMPIQYAGVVAEHNAVRTGLGLFDVSHMGEVWVEGANAVARVNRLITNDLTRVAEGKAVYTCCCNARGTILDDLIVYRVAEDSVLVVCNASNRDKIVQHLQHELGAASVQDRSDETALIAVQGPRAWGTLEKLAKMSIALSRFQTTTLTLLGQPCRIARTGYTGEDGFELFCDNNAAESLWNALLEHGAEFGAVPVGLAARDTLRLEAKLALYGNDIDETTNPIEAGLAWTVKFDKADFIGKSALVQVVAEGPKRKLVGFEMIGRGIARHGYPLLSNAQEPLGICTSGAPSPTLGKNIGLGYLPVNLAELGSEFLVDCRGRMIAARVVPTPFYRAAK
jgi:aminomethyltransferase